MGRRGFQPESTSKLVRRGSSYGKRRAEGERLAEQYVEVEAKLPSVLDQMAIALATVPKRRVVDIARLSGVGESALSRFVNGKSNLSGDSVDRLCYILGLRLIWSPTELSIDFDRRPEPGAVVGQS